MDALFADFTPKTPGAAVLAATGRSILYEKYCGLANLEYRIPIDARTRFNLASISKPLTATGIMLLAQNQRLTLDDRLTDYFPRWRRYYHEVRIRHLLSHTSGMTMDLPPGVQRPRRFSSTYGNEDLVNLLAQYHPRLKWTPGQRYEYCNLGFILLAQIIEKVAKMPFERFMYQRVFCPFGMRGACLLTERKPVIPRRAYAYGFYSDQRAFNTQDGLEFTTGDGGVCATARDLLRYWRTLMAGKVLKPEFRAAMFTPVIAQPEPHRFYGLGWRIDKGAHGARISHTGTYAGFANILCFYPSLDLFMVVLSNACYCMSQARREEIAAALARELIQRA